MKQSDKRFDLWRDLQTYRGVDAGEEAMRLQALAFVASEPHCFERTLQKGHITCSAWIIDPTEAKVLLTHHAKLERWLQLGGHADGDADTIAVATREGEEESGLQSLRLLSSEIFDVGAHLVPERGNEPEHYHFDIRYLFTADSNETLVISSESKDLAWIPLKEIDSLAPDSEISRMARKAMSLSIVN